VNVDGLISLFFKSLKMLFGTFPLLSCCVPLVFFVLFDGDLGETITEGSGSETTGEEDERGDSFDDELDEEVKVGSMEEVEIEVKTPPFLLPFFVFTFVVVFSSVSGRGRRGGSPFGGQVGTIEGESKSEIGRT
jgi:hypothetical protein